MATLEKRLDDLEAKAASTEHRVRVYYLNEGENDAEARLKAGIPVDYVGRVMCLVFVDSPNALKETPYGNT